MDQEAEQKLHVKEPRTAKPLRARSYIRRSRMIKMNKTTANSPRGAPCNKNANDYEQIMRDTHTDYSHISWITGLRSGFFTNSTIPKTPNVPSVYQRYVSSSQPKQRKIPSDVTYKGNALDILHLIKSPRLSGATLGQIGFETSLRTYNNTPKATRAKFVLIPHKYKTDEPVTFLPPKRPVSVIRMKLLPFLQKTRKVRLKGFKNETELITSFEGPQAHPTYTGKLREADFSKTRHLFKGGKDISTIGWECGLRSYKKK